MGFFLFVFKSTSLLKDRLVVCALLAPSARPVKIAGGRFVTDGNLHAKFNVKVDLFAVTI